MVKSCDSNLQFEGKHLNEESTRDHGIMTPPNITPFEMHQGSVRGVIVPKNLHLNMIKRQVRDQPADPAHKVEDIGKK